MLLFAHFLGPRALQDHLRALLRGLLGQRAAVVGELQLCLLLVLSVLDGDDLALGDGALVAARASVSGVLLVARAVRGHKTQGVGWRETGRKQLKWRIQKFPHRCHTHST